MACFTSYFLFFVFGVAGLFALLSPIGFVIWLGLKRGWTYLPVGIFIVLWCLIVVSGISTYAAMSGPHEKTPLPFCEVGD